MIYTIFAILVVLSATLCYALYRERLTDRSKLLALPMVLLVSSLMGYNYMDELGKPREGMPETFIYVHHVSAGEVTELWAKDEKTQESKLYTFEYNADNEKKLQQAQEATKGGVPIKGELDPSGKLSIETWESEEQEELDIEGYPLKPSFGS